MGLSKTDRRLRIKRRIRKISFGTPERPRLAVFRSNKEIYAQVIDDTKGVTIASASSQDKELKAEGTKNQIAVEVGKSIAKKAMDKGVSEVAFDRGGNLYHGRVKSLAEGAREGGLKF